MDDRPPIEVSLVVELVASRFPHWAGRPVRPVEHSGWDNRMFRLGDDLVVRLPSAERYAAQVKKEQEWLPRLAPHLPLAVPVPVAMAAPGAGFPWPWSVYRWIEGEHASRAPIDDLPGFARSLAEFLGALQRIDPAGGPPAGPHNFFRGGPLATYDAETRGALSSLDGVVDRDTATEVWEAALDSAWTGDGVWVHGDVHAANLLVADGRLAAVIDFGGLGVGDPACDTTIRWVFFSGESREVFERTLALDPATWARGRGWALWKALTILAEHRDSGSRKERIARRVIADVLSER